MKIKNANVGALTNFEVLDFLRSRGASKGPGRYFAPVAPSELKVYDYLVETVACNQTREQIDGFLEKSKKYDLAKAEIITIINNRPSQLVEIDAMVEQGDIRFGDQQEELLELVQQVLPPPPAPLNHEDGSDENKEETENGGQNDKEVGETAGEHQI